MLAPLVASFPVACGGARAFVCEADDQCSRADGAGTCEAGFCAFPDVECPSGKRYGGLSGERAGECVPGDAVGTDTLGSEGGDDDGMVGSSGDASTGEATLAISGDTSSGAGSTDPTTGASSTSDSTGATSGGSSSDSGAPDDDVHNYVFITSSAAAVSSFGGLAGADARCDALAADAGLPGQYVAWLSTTDVDAIDRLGDAQGWARVDGLPFARSAAAIVAGEHLYPIRLDEGGVDRLGTNVVTATAADGTYFGPTDCGGWTSTVGDARRASSDALGDVFTTNFDGACDVSIRTYCFGVDDAIDVLIDLPAPGRRAFLTTETMAASEGLSAFDAQCQAEARAAGVPGEFSALVATTTTAASERFDLTGSTWSLLNDVPIVQNAADLGAPGAVLLAPIWLSVSGVDEGGGGVWHGSTEPAAVASGTSCGDWAVTTGEGLVGVRARSAQWWGTSPLACTDSRRVMCLQQ